MMRGLKLFRKLKNILDDIAELGFFGVEVLKDATQIIDHVRSG